MTRRTPEIFDSRPYQFFSLASVTPTIGAEISGVHLRAVLSDETTAWLRRVLFVNMAFTQRIAGVPEAESNVLLAMLYRHLQRPKFQVRPRWQANTVAFWDNRSCQPYAASD